MPLRQSRFWMFWGLLMCVGAILLFQMQISLNRPAAQVAAAESVKKSPPPQQEPEINTGTLVDITKKAACRHNVQVINTLVELWYLNHDGQWPKNDLSDIGRDKDYFPKGIARCPVTGEAYRLDPVTHWVIGHEHGSPQEFEEQLEEETHGERQRRGDNGVRRHGNDVSGAASEGGDVSIPYFAMIRKENEC